MHSDHFHPSRWHRTALGLAAVAAWLLATLLFARYTAALRESLIKERLVTGAGGWIAGVVAFALLARLFRLQPRQ